jgi:hypothetical protein
VNKTEMLHKYGNISTVLFLKLAYEDNYYLNTSKELANINFIDQAENRDKQQNCYQNIFASKAKIAILCGH